MVYSSIAKSYFDEFPFRRRDKRKPSSGYFFLSHAHSDHTVGLKSMSSDPDPILVCSRETAAAIQFLYRFPKERILEINSNQSLDFDDFIVHALDANHCVGSLMYVIESKNGTKEVFTGDFRFHSKMKEEFDLIQGAETLWVDFTYGKDPIFNFPTREEMISDIITFILSSEKYPENTVWVAAYQIGKENLLKTLSKVFKVKLWAPDSKLRIYKEIGGEWDIFTSNETSKFHVESRRFVEDLHGVEDEKKLSMLSALRISPTGWALKLKDKHLDVHFFPYSDHCSFPEVHEFIKLVNPKNIIKI
ncbi:MBL fold metallo-hydrolase [Candidatus Hodarchaeum mangrovi]